MAANRETVHNRPDCPDRAASPHGGTLRWLQLQDRLAELHQPTPCQKPATAARWISDQPADQQAAAHACCTCPALEACRAYAVSAHEPAGVWGATRPADRRHAQEPDE